MFNVFQLFNQEEIDLEAIRDLQDCDDISSHELVIERGSGRPVDPEQTPEFYEDLLKTVRKLERQRRARLLAKKDANDDASETRSPEDVSMSTVSSPTYTLNSPATTPEQPLSPEATSDARSTPSRSSFASDPMLDLIQTPEAMRDVGFNAASPLYDPLPFSPERPCSPREPSPPTFNFSIGFALSSPLRRSSRRSIPPDRYSPKVAKPKAHPHLHKHIPRSNRGKPTFSQTPRSSRLADKATQTDLSAVPA